MHDEGRPVHAGDGRTVTQTYSASLDRSQKNGSCGKFYVHSHFMFYFCFYLCSTLRFILIYLYGLSHVGVYFATKVGRDPTGRAGRWEEGGRLLHTRLRHATLSRAAALSSLVPGPEVGGGTDGSSAVAPADASLHGSELQRPGTRHLPGTRWKRIRGFPPLWYRASATVPEPSLSSVACLPGPGRGRACDSSKPCACVRPLRSAAGAGGTPTHVTYCAW